MKKIMSIVLFGILIFILTGCGGGGGSSSSSNESSGSDNISADVSASGGEVEIPTGDAGVDIPAGALGSETPITVALSKSATPSGNLTAPYEFGPDGQTFSSPVTISLKYDPAALPSGVNPSGLKLAYLSGGNWEIVPSSSADTVNHVVSGQTNHFSIYSVVAGTSTGSTYGISGIVSGSVVAGVTITLSGASSATTTTDSNGDYIFSNLANGSYTINASKADYNFTPSGINVTVNNADVTRQNFVASATTNPDPNPVTPSGSITGVVRDACTLEPIEGAIVSISGIAGTNTTKADGSYTFKNLPATIYADTTQIENNLEIEIPDTTASIDAGWRGYYTVVITIPATAKIDGVAVSNYAETYYDRLEVKFTSSESGGASVTVVEGINGSENFDIGKLRSTITGNVVYGTTYKPVPAGFTVYLINRETSISNDSGEVGNVVKMTLTNSDGTFTLTGVENNQKFTLYAADNNANPSYLGSAEIQTNCDTIIPVGIIKVMPTN